MVTAIDLSTARWTESRQRPRVYLRARWDEPWIEYETLYCVTLRMGVGAQIDEATIEYDYGKIRRANQADPQIDARLSIDRRFVKVVMDSPNSSPAADLDGFVWYGVIIAHVDNRAGTAAFETHTDGTEPTLEDDAGAPLTDDAGGVLLTDGAGGLLVDDEGDPILTETAAAGRQVFTAFGMEWLLTRVWIDKSVYEDTGGNDVEIGRVVPFNSGTKQQLEAMDVQTLGNRAPGQNRFIRPDAVADAVPWTAFNILQYLFEVFKPTNAPTFALHATVEAHTAWWQKNNLLLGPTLWDAINELVSQRRGLTWSIHIEDAEAVPVMYLRIHSFSDEDISLSAGKTLQANDSMIELHEGDKRHIDVLVVNDTSRLFEQVKVVGARRGACFTINWHDSTMEAGWSDFQLDAYANAASGVTPLGEKKKQADAFRSTDTMANVLTRFIIPHYWDGLVGMRQPPYTFFPACPALDFAGNIIQDESVSFWHPGLRIATWIPLRENVDYQYDAAAPDNYNDDSVLPPYRKPFALYKMPDDTYVRSDRANVLVKNELVTTGKDGIKFSSFVTPTSDQFGIHIRPSTLAHVQANTSDILAKNANFTDTTDVETVVDWKDAIVTVFAEFDEHVTAVYPSIPNAGTNGQQSIQMIHLGNIARLDYLAPETVIDVAQDGTLITNADGGFVRDDRPLMEDIARVAWKWYSQKRTALTVQINHVSSEVQVGQLMTFMGGDAVNSLVTHISYNFQEGTTTVNTDFAELDPVGLFV